MLFDDQAGLVIPIESLLWIEKCTDVKDHKPCIRYVTREQQGVTVRPYACEAVRDEVFRTCRHLMGQVEAAEQAWNKWNQEMMKKGVIQQMQRLEKEDKGW